jgi:RNA polymerase sigma factor (sigma-70 family)
MRGSDDFADMHGGSNFEGAVDVDRDRALVERCQAGDRDAFDALYLHYHQRLLRFCVKRLQERSESEDVVQETFARAWRALPTFAGDRRFYPWLTVIAGNLCTDVLRRRSRLTSLDETMMRSSDVGTYDIEDAVLQDVDAQMVTTAFENLKPRHQRVLDLRERSGWSYQKIADEEGVGVSAVETLLWRARNALKREFALLAGAEGKAGALIGVAMTVPRNGLRRLSTSFRNHVPASFRHAMEAGRHAASAVTPAGASIAAAGAVVVGLGAVYLSPGTSAIATPTGTGTTTVVSPNQAPALGGAPPTTTLPPLTTSPADPGPGGSASVPAPTGNTATGSVASSAGSPNRSSSVTPGTVTPGTGSQPDPAPVSSQPLSGVGNALAGAGSGAGGAVSGLGGVAGGVVGSVGGAVGGVVGGVGGALGSVGGVVGGVGGAVGGVGGVVGSVGGALGGTGATGGGSGSGLGQATTGVTGLVGGAVSGAGSGAGNAITGITGGVGNVLGGPSS